jgi:hypothetical protein
MHLCHTDYEHKLIQKQYNYVRVLCTLDILTKASEVKMKA